MNEEIRRAKVREYNVLRREVQDLRAKLERMEEHEGDDGTPADIDGQCRLVEEIASKTRRITELKREIYPS